MNFAVFVISAPLPVDDALVLPTKFLAATVA